MWVVVLAGGRGERLWPASRCNRPKQFIGLLDGPPLIQLTYRRALSLVPLDHQLYVVPERLSSKLRQALPEILEANLLLEPEGKNTALACGIAAQQIALKRPDEELLVLPSDQLITQEEEFKRCVEFGRGLAKEGWLVVFGVPPTRPETGYGYIQLGPELVRSNNYSAHRVERFKEKPSYRLARRYLASGAHLWNSGIFLWRADVFLEALRTHMPELFEPLQHYRPKVGTDKERRARRALYRAAPKTSIDYGVLEHAQNLAVVRATFDWDDLGSWLALERWLPKDLDRNVSFGHTCLMDVKDSIIWSDSGYVAGLGVEGLVVVKANNLVLVAKKERIQGLKQLIERLGPEFT
jgi:mannose-1-phosphate guanylyltransferase